MFIRTLLSCDIKLSLIILLQNNTVQGLFITNGTKTYAVFTYKCEYLDWSGHAVIGFNAAGDYFEYHPLSELSTSNLVACVHQWNGSEWNNVIYDLVPNPELLTYDTTPVPTPNVFHPALGENVHCYI